MRMHLHIRITLAVLLLCASPAMGEPHSLVIYECGETQTCSADGKCVSNRTRVAIAHVAGPDNAKPYYTIGPLVPEAGGGTFFAADMRWVLGGIPTPSETVGRAKLLSMENGITMSAHVYRPGREVRGLKKFDWVRADYSCKQKLF
jgi:hypothetical protein